MKHYTSKLSTYSDLTTLETFGFRGEALSSLCALSRFIVTTCLQTDVPKGTRLEFETSGKVKGTSVVAAQKGTTVSVENLFQNLPVRRRELERNIKREWGKVIGLLNQYACIQSGVKFTVSQTPNKGKRIVLFSTKGNKTTRENIINVFGAKTMAALVALDLKLEFEATSGPSQRWNTQEDSGTKEVQVKGYVSRPVHGEGRQTPDRQMFYVNSRPCGLPQFAKVFNEVYRSFNSSQSPFIFADIQLDTRLYDVNVSPDKRTILLHDQSRMLDNLRDSLTELFEKQDFTVPMSHVTPFRQPAFKKLTVARQETTEEQSAGTTPDKVVAPACESSEQSEASDDDADTPTISRMKKFAAAKTLARDAQASNLMTRWVEGKSNPRQAVSSKQVSPTVERFALEQTDDSAPKDGPGDKMATVDDTKTTEVAEVVGPSVQTNQGDDDLLTRLSKLKRSFMPESLQDELSDSEALNEPSIPAISKPVKPSDDAPLSVSMAKPPKRISQEVATITIGDHTVTSIIGAPAKMPRMDEPASEPRRSRKPSKLSQPAAPLPTFGGRLTQMFAAAAAKQHLPTGEEQLHAEALEPDEDSRYSEDDDSEATTRSAEENAVSDKSSPLFMVQDDDQSSASPEAEQEDERSSIPPQDEGDGAGGGNDREDINEEDREAQEDDQVQKTIETAEEPSHKASEDNEKRTQVFLKGGTKGKYSTQVLLQRLKIDEESLKRRFESWETQLKEFASSRHANGAGDLEDGLEAENAEEKLSLAIHKGDFGKMKIVGQFNLGFVLAVRPRSTSTASVLPTATRQALQEDDEFFIIDQHASDEKFNFERLQSATTVQSQRLVRPKPLELTAIEEEIVIENQAALEKNGFVVSVDESGDEPVGSRCQLLALPLSRETTFSLADLEELISLLGDSPTTTTTAFPGDDEGGQGRQDGTRKYIPRPSKVRKMFAMRACRSSIMIGKALSHRQMEIVVRHMGEMEKPWNCPHGRPTMRHLCGLGSAWDEMGWKEGSHSGVLDDFDASAVRTDWAGYAQQMKEGM